MIKWLTIQDVIDIFGITKRNQERLRQEKLIPYYKVGKLVRYKHDELDEWLSNKKIS